MILSKKRNYVFVHIFKTAGTSIKRALRRDALAWWQEPANSVLKRIAVPQFKPSAYPDHFTASSLIEHIGRESFDSLFSFAFIRNPWDWEVSHYKYICRSKHHHCHQLVKSMPDFGTYLRWRCNNHYQKQQDFLTHDGNIVVDFVGRFENLREDFETVCQQIGIRRRLPKLNATRKKHYTTFYTDELAELVQTTYARDIKLFGYEFA